MEVERYLLGSALTGIVSQKLVKKLCPKCRKTRPTTPYEKKLIKKHLGTQVNEVYTPVGCECCNHGYLGRIAIHEVLSINEEIREAITANVDRKTLKDLVYHSKKDITTSFEDGLTKVIEGLTSMEEIMKTVDVESDEELVA